jgi:ABC-type Fe3+/spermidine/putrescine transport system ATPase subunit
MTGPEKVREDNDSMIEVKNLVKKFRHITAVDHVNLKVKKGELMTLLGPSGCGKTTLLRCITGHLEPDGGRIFIDGKDVTIVPTHKRELGMVFQAFALFPHMTAYENTEFPLKIRGFPKTDMRERVEEAIEMVKLKGWENQYPRHLSGGQQQRIGLARALVYRPKILLMDEPLSNLDAKLREQMRFEIKDLQAHLNITTLYVTHDQEEALALSNSIAIMNEGEIHQVGTPREIYEEPRTKFVADFIGLANFIKGIVGDFDSLGRAMVSCEDIGQLIVPLSHDLRKGAEALVFIRPNDIQLLDRDDERAEDNAFEGVIEKATYLGEKVDYRIKAGNKVEMRVQVGGMGRFRRGDKVKVHLPVDRCQTIVSD